MYKDVYIWMVIEALFVGKRKKQVTTHLSFNRELTKQIMVPPYN